MPHEDIKWQGTLRTGVFQVERQSLEEKRNERNKKREIAAASDGVYGDETGRLIWKAG